MSRMQHFSIFCIFWILISNTYISYGQTFSHDSDELSTAIYWLRRIEWNKNQAVRNSPSSYRMQKRDCSGFPCMYTHMAGTAGNASIRLAKLTLLRECLADPNCSSVGKRSHSKYDFLNKLIER